MDLQMDFWTGYEGGETLESVACLGSGDAHHRD